ncbi:MAG: iron ABC transporter permease [Chloroflexi bacterium]|nr:iron ABC transporter permease [Chloroflexota bacterium]
MVLPLAYLMVRTVSAGGEALELLWQPRTLEVLGRTLLLAATVSFGAVTIAVPVAWLTVRSDLPGRRLWAVATVLPLGIPSFVGGLAAVAALGPRGMLQQLLERPFGVERLPEIYGFFGAALVLTLLTYPYVLLSVRAALWGLDPALEEASRNLGQGPWHTFRRVVLPHLRPAIVAGALLVALYTLSDFGAVSLLRFDSFTRVIYLQYQSSFDRTLAAVFSLVLVALAAALLVLEARTRGKARYHRSTVGVLRPPRTVALGHWRWPALGFCALLVSAALLMPVAVLAYWLARGLAAGEPLRLVWQAAANSLYVSALAALATVAAALPVTVLLVRYPGRVSALVERATYVGFALPGIVIALALVFFGANFAPFLYQTLGLLVLAYVVRFLPQAVGAARASLLQVNPSLEEAARSLGHSPTRVLATVVVPLVRPGILAGAALVFLTTMKELPATLLLSPIGFKTLATSIWSAAEAAFFARAAAPALLLLLVAAVPTALLMLGEGERQR